MKKTFQISIAKVLFIIEEDAYSVLDKYITSIKEHFAHTEGSEEIVADIESRIAEQLFESKQKIITLDAVESILSSMGKVEDFDDKESIIDDGSKEANKEKEGKQDKNQEKNQDKSTEKKLYRDPDDTIIAGVCSGLAKYFGIDTVLMRIIFIAFTFMSGFGVLLYIVLWLIMPVAKTGAQKLEMSGSPVTLETISSAVSERVEEIKKKDSSTIKNIISFPFKLIKLITQYTFKVLAPFLRILTGVLLLIISISWMVGTVVAGGFLFSGATTIDGVSLNTLLNDYLAISLILSLVLVSLIPALFVFLGGISLLRRKISIPSFFAFILFGIWFITLFLSAFGITKAVYNYNFLVETSPEYQEVTKVLPINGEFKNVKVTDGIDIKVIEGKMNELSITGREVNIASIKGEVIDDVLVISKEQISAKKKCFFCISGMNSTTLVLTLTKAPGVVTVEEGSRMEGDFSRTEALEVIVKDGSNAEIVALSKKINVRVEDGSRLRISSGGADDGIGDGDGAGASGSVSHSASDGVGDDIVAISLNATLTDGSILDADELSVENAEITASSGSYTTLNVQKKLNVTLTEGSIVSYSGEPVISKKISSGSVLRTKRE